MPAAAALGTEISPHQKALYGLGVAFAAYGVAVLPPEGNGLIAVFVCAIVLGILRPDIREAFERRSEDIIEVVKLGVFVVFGALLTANGLFDDGLAAVGDRALHAVRRAPDRGARVAWPARTRRRPSAGSCRGSARRASRR